MNHERAARSLDVIILRGWCFVVVVAATSTGNEEFFYRKAVQFSLLSGVGKALRLEGAGMGKGQKNCRKESRKSNNNKEEGRLWGKRRGRRSSGRAEIV